MRDRVVLVGLDHVFGIFHRHLMDATPLGVDGRLDGVSGTLMARHCWLAGLACDQKECQRARGFYLYTGYGSTGAFPKKGKHSPLRTRPGGQAWGEGERDLALALPITLISWGNDYGWCYWLRTNQKTKGRDLHESYNPSVRAVPVRK